MAILKKTPTARVGSDIMTSGQKPDVCSFLGMPAVVSSARMRTLMQFVERIAKSDAAVLITGESGCGKDPWL